MSILCSLVIKETHSTIAKLLESFTKVQGDSTYAGSLLLDIGCWDGITSEAFAKAAGIKNVNVFGVDIFPEIISKARERINAVAVDLEKESLPFPTDYFDFVLCNQVLEHLKNIFLSMTEIWRVTKQKGIVILSTPNLAAFHNRILLLLGRQPSCIRLFGPHVRGVTFSELVKFATYKNLFTIERVVGVGWHPLPAHSLVCRLLARLFPSLSHTVVLVLRKNALYLDTDCSWVSWLKEQHLQTNY